MQKQHYTIDINAPREKVWEIVTNPQTYAQWVRVFGEGSHFQGDWSVGSKMLFLAPNSEGKMDGMIATIAENTPPEFISIKHIGYLMNGVEDTESDRIKAWAPAFENYTFESIDSGTRFTVDIDVEDEYKEMFEEMWPKALAKIKELSEA